VVVRAVVVLGMLVALSGCVSASAPDAGNWKIERGHDRILGKPSAVAQLNARSRNAHEAERRYLHDQLQIGSLQLTCFDNAPVIRLEFSHRIGSNRTSTLSYRFDENPGRDAKVRFLATYKIAVIEDAKEVAQFVEQLRASNKLYVRIVSHVAGTSDVEFALKGAPAAVDAAFQSCPVDQASRPRTAAASQPRMRRSVSS
jgi:hypothetical protein